MPNKYTKGRDTRREVPNISGRPEIGPEVFYPGDGTVVDIQWIKASLLIELECRAAEAKQWRPRHRRGVELVSGLGEPPHAWARMSWNGPKQTEQHILIRIPDGTIQQAERAIIEIWLDPFARASATVIRDENGLISATNVRK